MKSLILAFIFFGLLVFGLYDVKSFKHTLRKAARKAKGEPRLQTGPIAPEPPPVEDPRYYSEPPVPTRRYR